MRVLLQIHAKPPRPGVSKTRLGAVVGQENAAALAQAFLRDTLRVTRSLAGVDVVLVTPEPEVPHGVDAERWDQGGGDLGARLERAFRRGLEQWDLVVALGADAPGLPLGHLRALIAIGAGGPAIGPAEDGGFWGLALRDCPPGLLAGVRWSAPTTAGEVSARLPGVVRGPTWWDVDEVADLRRVAAEVDPSDAPETFAALRGLRA